MCVCLYQLQNSISGMFTAGGQAEASRWSWLRVEKLVSDFPSACQNGGSSKLMRKPSYTHTHTHTHTHTLPVSLSLSLSLSLSPSLSLSLSLSVSLSLALSLSLPEAIKYHRL